MNWVVNGLRAVAVSVVVEYEVELIHAAAVVVECDEEHQLLCFLSEW